MHDVRRYVGEHMTKYRVWAVSDDPRAVADWVDVETITNSSAAISDEIKTLRKGIGEYQRRLVEAKRTIQALRVEQDRLLVEIGKLQHEKQKLEARLGPFGQLGSTLGG